MEDIAGWCRFVIGLRRRIKAYNSHAIIANNDAALRLASAGRTVEIFSWGVSLETRNIYRLPGRDGQYWRHPLNLDGADPQA